MTLKKRIFLLFFLSAFIPFISIFAISYYTIDSIFANKINDGIRSNLQQVTSSLENSITNLNHVTQQLSYSGTLGKKLDEVLKPSSNIFELIEARDELKNELNVVTFTNPNIGLTLYYFQKEGTTQFANFPIKDRFSPESLPVLSKSYGIAYYGPHMSMNRFDDQLVLSAMRKVQLPQRDDVYIYVESGFRLTQDILGYNQYKGALSHLILNGEGNIVYSEIPEAMKVGENFSSISKGTAKDGISRDYHWFKEDSSQNWSVISVISQAKYQQEKNQWLLQILLVALFFLGFTVFLAWLLWKMVYKPLGLFHSEINGMSQNPQKAGSQTRTQIPEFDFLLGEFSNMQHQIGDLFKEVQQKEKIRADLEVEKLLYQINPHFLMNTLDTVHWLAVMNGQGEIDKLVQSLNKLLYYNLGKLGQVSTMEEEIDALRQYLILQQIRYDFEFDVRISADDQVLQIPVPRFILQPLVENSLYHGLSDEGFIQIEVTLAKTLNILIQDNGAGMTEEAIQRLLNNRIAEHKKVGMGIGLNYVHRMLRAQYGDQAQLVIESELGTGTSILLILPIKGEDV
ncbi:MULTISPECIES: sensor histidine kinase [Paenibacillus]|jgi:two-component system sensor histidine kinase YesM|uniref:histidine kinase n=3 Tax=Paenibacillus TaxID=44249 RepID=A0ABX2ZDS9_PAEPO|nr:MULTISPECIES: histidine kinase [Paenibacillus]ALA42399.1 histidine kinase [Paenibacillus peoriae]APB75879.1 two-component system sensor histidine kinase DcuS [Paenibacillus polymyxa]MBP1176505.1 two-component system sensor histidine kinase YesM [Paenibacillus sp. PvR133]MDR6775945.1 two-component system sensor histidine kinase YesM [Paenibacillus peoriae]MXO80517.1 sensor histidine kinase [Paenibacillus sp. OT2-17]